MWRQKKEDTQKTSISNSLCFISSSHQQGTTLETREQHHWVKHWNQTQHSLNSIWVVKTKEYKRHPSTIHSFPFPITTTDNGIGDTGATSLSEALKSSTTLIKLNLRSENKRKKNTQKTSINNSLFPFLLHQQTTTLETQVQHHWVKHWY